MLAQENMNAEHARADGRRVSSPIAIPSGKIAQLNRIATNAIQEQQEHSNSPVSSPGSFSVSPQVTSSSLPLPARQMHLSRIYSDGHHESNESINDVLDELPDCSPAFSAVFSELVKIEDRTPKKAPDSSLHVTDGDIDSMNSTPNLPRKELRFAIDEEFERMRPRASSHSMNRRSRKKNAPSSTHSTPALSRRAGNKSVTRPVNVIPKYKFVTETITISHEDIVKQQESQERLTNGYPSPKSIFSVVGGK